MSVNISGTFKTDDLLRDELAPRRADELLARENAGVTDEWHEEADAA